LVKIIYISPKNDNHIILEYNKNIQKGEKPVTWDELKLLMVPKIINKPLLTNFNSIWKIMLKLILRILSF
jgi:hypothetical protein